MLLGLNIFFAHNTSYNTDNFELTTQKIHCINDQT